MRSTSPGSGASLPRSPQIPHMPGTQGYAVVSCHVERPLDDAVWERYREPHRAAARAGSRSRRCCGRRPTARTRSCSSSARARRRRSGRSGTTRTGRRRRTRARPAAIRPSACSREGRWLREQGLEPRFFCGGGWYMDAGVMRRRRRARLRRLHRDAVRGRRSCRPARRARRSTRPRGSASTTAGACSSCRARTRSARPRARSRGDCRRSCTSTSTTTSCSTAKRRAALDGRRCGCSRGGGGRSSRARSRPSARWRGRTCAPTDRRSPRSRRRCSRRAARARTEATQGISVRVDEDPFRITVLRDGETVVTQDEDARLRYQLASSGEQHKLTKVTRRRRRQLGDSVYEVATDEPGRTATVTRAPDAAGRARLASRLHPETDVQQVYDAFDDRPRRALPRRRRARRRRRPARRRSCQIKVVEPCALRAGPVLRELGGLGRARSTRRTSRRSRSPGSPGGTGCQFGDEPAVRLPAARGPRRGLRDRARGSTRTSTSARSRETLARLRRRRGRPRVPPPSELELIKWRDGQRGPGAGARRHRALAGGRRSRSAGCCSTTRGRRASARSTFDATRFPDPAGLIRRGPRARRALHALGLAEGRSATPATRRGALLGDRPSRPTLDLRRPRGRPPSTRRGCAGCVALGVDGVKGDRGDEVDLEAIDPTLQNALPGAVRAAPSARARRTARRDLPRRRRCGSQRVLPGLWAGDQAGDWDGLQRAIRRRRRRAAMSGFPTWGSDVGGYRSEELTADVFARWAQLGAVSPVMEVGGIGPNATPWMLGPTAMRALQRRGRPALRALPVPLRPAREARAGAAAARLRVPGRSRGLARRPRAARRPRPARRAGRRAGHDAERLPPGGRRGSTSTPARRVTGRPVVHAPDAADRVPVLRPRTAP